MERGFAAFMGKGTLFPRKIVEIMRISRQVFIMCYIFNVSNFTAALGNRLVKTAENRTLKKEPYEDGSRKTGKGRVPQEPV